MRISDWSSDVCSSDLRPGIRDERAGALVAAVPGDPVGAGGALFQRRIPRRAARRTRCRCAARAAVRQADTDDGGQAVTNDSITAADLFEQMRERLDLHWIGGQQGESRVLEARSEEHTSELQSLMRIQYADYCLKQKKKQT